MGVPRFVNANGDFLRPPWRELEVAICDFKFLFGLLSLFAVAIEHSALNRASDLSWIDSKSIPYCI